MKRKLSITKLLTSLLTLLLLTSVVSTAVFAKDGDEVYFMHREDYDSRADAEQDITALINGDPVNMTYYCLQRHLTPPTTEKPKGGHVKYVESASASGKISDEDRIKISRIAYAGYPNNSVGIFDEIYTQDPPIYTNDYWAANITQEAIWAIVEKAGLEGNDDVHSRDHQYGWMPECYLEAYQNLLAYGEDKNNVLPGSISSGKVTISGDATFEKAGKGLWSTDYLEITDPLGYQMEFDLPEGISAVDKDGNALVHLIGGKKFKLITNDSSNIKKDSKLVINTTITYPDGTTFYVQDEEVKRSDNPGSVELQYYQIITASKVGSAKLEGSVDLMVGNESTSAIISKVIADGSEEAAKGIDFKFNVVIKDEDGKPVEGVFPTEKHCGVAGRGVITGNVETDENGECQIELQGGDHIVIDGLPLGSTVTVTEVKVKGWSAEVSSDTKDGEMYFTFTNTYDPSTDKDPTGGNGSGTSDPGDKPADKPAEKPGSSGSGSTTTYIVPDTSCK